MEYFRSSPKGGAKSTQWKVLADLLSSICLYLVSGRWVWSLTGLRDFFVPIKVNVLAWKLSLDKHPTSANLYFLGVDVPSLQCAIFRLVLKVLVICFFRVL